VLTEEVADGRSALVLAGATAVATGVGIAVVGSVGAPEAQAVGHWAVFVGMVLSVAGVLVGRPSAREVRAPASEVLRDADR
jgi:predicted cobalt transporter CbtA